MVVVHKTKLWQPAHFGRPGIHRIKHAGRGGGAVLRVGRQYQHAGDALGFEQLQLRGNRRVAVAHGVAHLDMVTKRCQLLAQHASLLLCPHLQRRALGHPNAGVLGG